MKIINSVTRIVGLVAMGVLAAMMLLTVADVLLRFSINKPIIGTTEITELMMVVAVFLGFAWCALRGKHVRVELVVSRYSPSVQAVIDSIIYLVGLVIVVILGWQTFLESLNVQRLHLTYSYIEVPKFPFYMVVALGYAVLFLAMVALLVQNIMKVAKR